ncbi:MAG TPA: glycosyltransferase family 39 protein [Acidimicrobiales bacterium]|nr:glycosyltransferase family 39 protein [Acidimicrobiales bacterium]
MVVTGTEPAPAVPSPAGTAAAPSSPHAFELAGVALAVVAGVVLRFWTRSHLWLDEALSVDIARLPLGDIPAALRHDGHPPLYYFLLHGWIALFGQGDVAVRSLSGVFSVAAIPLAWFAGRRVGGRMTAWAFVALLAVSPFAIRYGTETRMYSLVMLLVLAGYLLVANALERTRPLRLIGIALVTGGLLLAHYWALWLVGATVVVLAWQARRCSGDARRRTLRTLLAVVAGGVFLIPWLGVMLDQSAHTGTPWAAPVRPTTMITTTLQDLGGGEYAEGVLLGWSLMILFLVGLTARSTDRYHIELDVRTVPRVRREAAVVVLTLAIASVAGYASHTTFATRYVAALFPLFLLVAAVGLTTLLGRLPRSLLAAGLLVLGVVGGVHNVVTDRSQAGDITDVIRAESKPGDVVVMCPDQLGPSVHRLLPASLGLVQLSYPTLADPALVDWRDYADRNAAVDPRAVADRIAAMAHGGHGVWLVDSTSYKTFEGHCEAVEQELGAKLGGAQIRVLENGAKFFEHASLLQYPGSAT